MRRVFADSSYWIAVVKPKDQWSEIAHNASKSLGDAVLVTTDEVLTEFLTALSRGGPSLRLAAAKMVRAILGNANVRVIQQTREGFLKGVTRYEGREDKEYSLTDCISMNVMESQSLAGVLTNEHHFEQEGFNVLIKRSG